MHVEDHSLVVESCIKNIPMLDFHFSSLGSPVVFLSAYIPTMVYVVDLAPKR